MCNFLHGSRTCKSHKMLVGCTRIYLRATSGKKMSLKNIVNRLVFFDTFGDFSICGNHKGKNHTYLESAHTDGHFDMDKSYKIKNIS